jgi:hypothetical protein
MGCAHDSLIVRPNIAIGNELERANFLFPQTAAVAWKMWKR